MSKPGIADIKPVKRRDTFTEQRHDLARALFRSSINSSVRKRPLRERGGRIGVAMNGPAFQPVPQHRRQPFPKQARQKSADRQKTALFTGQDIGLIL